VRLRRAALRAALLGLTGVLLAAAPASHADGGLRSAVAPGPHLIFDDEFNGLAGSSPNLANWAHVLGGGGFGTHELESNTDLISNAHLDGAGHLLIVARRQDYTGPDGVRRQYTSARLITRTGDFVYGRAEIRAKFPPGMGLWPAFFAMGGTSLAPTWPITGEYDLMEGTGEAPNLSTATAHGPIFGPGQTRYHGVSGHYQIVGQDWLPRPLSAGFHVYAVDVSPGLLTFSLDGVPYLSVTPASLPPGGGWVFNSPVYFVLDLAVGSWGGPPGRTAFPKSLIVDYVRIYAG